MGTLFFDKLLSKCMKGIGKLLTFGLFSSITFGILVLFLQFIPSSGSQTVLSAKIEGTYWLVLHRKSQTEMLYLGIPGKQEQSSLVKTFRVKTGIPGKSPTPLPSLLGKEYWLITKKEDSSNNPETAPYFLTLNIDAPEEWPYGPTPYTECEGVQCDWGKPGYFGLHGVGGDPSRLSEEDLGSSGCVRHSDTDIAYLYNLLDPQNEEIRYYIENN